MEKLLSVNPFNGEVLKEFPLATAKEIDAVLSRGNKAFIDWRNSQLNSRADLLLKCSQILLSKKEYFARIITSEMGKIYREAEAEVEKSAWVCRYYAENGAKFIADEPLEVADKNAFISYEPLGIILAVMPWNFPFWQVFRFAAPAVMAGNVGLLKHASNVPQCSLAIANVFEEAGFPQGVFQSVLASSEQVSEIIGDWRIKAVTLTGSELAGMSVASVAGKNIKKTVLELGGSDPFVVLEDADIGLAAQIGAQARMINCGQSCIAAKRFIVADSIHDEFINKFSDKINSLKMGDPMDDSTDYGPMARIDLAVDLNLQVERSLRKGAVSVMKSSKQGKKDAFFEADVLTGVTRGMPAYEEEIFGPVASVIRAKDENEAVQISNSSQFGLGASIWTTDIDRGKRVARQIESGAVFINQMVASHPAIPFGGIKMSGYGRELSYLGIREFMNAKSIVY